jgi:site-specific recombinase XerD
MIIWNTRYTIAHVGPDASWQKAIGSWIEYLKGVGHTPETIRTRWYQITRFSRLIHKPPENVTADDLISHLAAAELGPEARRSLVSCIRNFYKWAVTHNLALIDPTKDIPSIAVPQPSGLICPENAIEKALASPDEDTVLSVMLGAYCGLRRHEMTLVNLGTDISDDDSGMTLLIHGKGRKNRTLPVPKALAARITQRPKGFLFPGKIGGHVGVDYVAKRIKLATGYPPHSLRRRFATISYYRSGCNLLLVSRMLGHSDVTTTMRYIGLQQDQMRNTVEAAAQIGLPELDGRENGAPPASFIIG